MIVSDVVMVEREPYSKTGGTHCSKICLYGGRNGSPSFIDYESGVAAPKDFLKGLLECEFKVERDT